MNNHKLAYIYNHTDLLCCSLGNMYVKHIAKLPQFFFVTFIKLFFYFLSCLFLQTPKTKNYIQTIAMLKTTFYV